MLKSLLPAIGIVFISFGACSTLFFADVRHWFVLTHLLLGAALLLASIISGVTNTKKSLYLIQKLVFIIFPIVICIGIYITSLRVDLDIDFSLRESLKLSKATSALLNKVTEQIEILVIQSKDREQQKQINNILNQYAAASRGLVSFRILDPVTAPEIVNNELKLQPGDQAVVRSSNNKSIVLQKLNEQELTKALLKFISDKTPLYILDTDKFLLNISSEGFSKLKMALEDLGYENQIVSELPKESANKIVIVMPTGKNEIQPNLVNWITNGGRALILQDPQARTNIDLEGLGVRSSNNVVLELAQENSLTREANWQFIVKKYAEHDVASGLMTAGGPVFLLASSLDVLSPALPGTYTKLLRTSDASWGETNLTQLFKSDSPQAVFDAGDIQGPLTVGLSYQGDIGRFVVYSDLEWLRDVNFDIQANKLLLQNSILWLSGFDSNQASISEQAVQLVPAKLFSQVMIGSLLVAEIILMLGLIVYFRRH